MVVASVLDLSSSGGPILLPFAVLLESSKLEIPQPELKVRSCRSSVVRVLEAVQLGGDGGIFFAGH